MALSASTKPLYKMNQQTILVMFISTKSHKIQQLMEKHIGDKIYNELELSKLLDGREFKKLKPQILYNLKTAMLVGAFYDGELGKTGRALVSDDAGQFNNLYDDHLLCWYHEMRHYKELIPEFLEHQNKLKEFFNEIKSMYKMLKLWIKTHKVELGDYIFKWFNKLFTTETGYYLLDKLKRKTFNKMDKLLTPLWSNLDLPLTNNESERDIRGKSIKKKISLFDRSWEGVKARDLYIGLKQTCRKNGVSFYNLIVDRSMKLNQIPLLSTTIAEASPQY